MGRKGTTKACDTQTHRRTTHIAQQTPETISFENPFINYHHNHKHFPSLPPFNMYNATKVYVHLFMIRYLFDCLNIFSDGPFACHASMRACMCIYAECAAYTQAAHRTMNPLYGSVRLRHIYTHIVFIVYVCGRLSMHSPHTTSTCVHARVLMVHIVRWRQSNMCW